MSDESQSKHKILARKIEKQAAEIERLRILIHKIENLILDM